MGRRPEQRGLGATAGLLCDVLATGDDGSRVAVASLVVATGLTGRTVRR